MLKDADRLDWPSIVTRAAAIVQSYDIPVTLRQLFYRCVMELLIPNTQTAYKTLSARTAALRRRELFPPLFDRGRSILQPLAFENPNHALDLLIEQYRLDRTAGQEVSVWLAVEKNALAGLLQHWFDEYGVPVLPLGGYSSEGLDRVVREQVIEDGRPAVLIYSGDFDSSGMDIGRAFIRTTDCWAHTVRIGLSEAQIETLQLPVLRGKPADSRAPKFIAEHPEIHTLHNFGRDDQGRLVPVQVELDAVDPAVLHRMFTDALDDYWDHSAYANALNRENTDVSELRALAASMGGR